MTLPASTFGDPLTFNQAGNSPQPQPVGGGGGFTPMPAQTGKNGNPFTDVLDHVSAFNDAMTAKNTSVVSAFSTGNPDAGTDSGVGSPAANPTTTPSSADPQAVLTKNPPAPLTPAAPRTHPSAPPQQWSAANPPPKPSDEDMKNSEIAADYYRKHAYINQVFANITAADVEAYRAFPQGMTIGDWYLAGHRASDPVPQGDPNGGNVAPRPGDQNTFQIIEAQNAAALAAAQPKVTPPNPPGAAAPPGTTPGGTTPPATGTPPATPPAGTQPPTTPPPATPPPDIQSLIDMFHKEAGTGNGPDVESMLNPMFARQRQKLDEQLRASAALTPGRVESGGFGMNEGQALSDLSGVQSGKMADALQQQHLAQMQQNTQLIQLGTQAGMQKYVADLNADMTKFQVNSNADLAKWLDNADNALKKYGIDTGDVLARYQSELQLKGQMFSAEKGVDAAALQAAAAHAAAAASAQASQANAQLQFNLGMQGLSVDREKNIGQFILGLLGIGNMDINSLNGILNGILPGTVAVKP